METLHTCFLPPPPPPLFKPNNHRNNHRLLPIKPKPITRTRSSTIKPDPWTLPAHTSTPKPPSKHPKNPLSDDNARRIITSKAVYLSTLRRNQGPQAQTPKWVRRSPPQMEQYLKDDRNGHLYGKHVVSAIKVVRSLSQKQHASYDIRKVLGEFVGVFSFRELCVVLKEIKGWVQVRDFFSWMKLQLCYHPSVIAYTIVLRAYGQVGKIKLAEETFLEMLDVGCEPDEIACGTMLCTYARWGRHKAMLAFYTAVQERGVVLSIAVYNFMMSSLQKKSLHQNVINIYKDMVDKRVLPNHFTFTVVICSLVKEGLLEEGLTTFNKMKSLGFVPEEVTYSLLITGNVKEGKQDEVFRLYEDMRYRDIIPSNYTCASLLTLYYKNGDYSKALSLFSEMERYKIRVDEVIYGLLVRIYGKLGLCEDAERTFKEAERLGLLSDEKTFIAMTQVYFSSGEYTKALNTMEEMKSRNILFSKFAYKILLKCYMMTEKLGPAEETFHFLSNTIVPDSISCNGMLNMFLRKNLLEKAKNFIAHIRKDNVAFDEELCKTVVRFYSREGMLREVEQFILDIRGDRSLENSGFIRTISMILDAKDGEFEKEHDLLGTDILDTNALELMLCLYISNGNDFKAGITLNSLLEVADGLSIVNQLIGKFIHEGDVSKAEFVSELLITRDSREKGEILASMISLYGKHQMWERAKVLLASVVNSSICGADIYNAAIDACVKCGQPGEGYELYKKSARRELRLSPIVISVLVNNLTYHGMHQEAEDVIQRSLHDDNLVLDTIAFNTFIKAMLEAGKLHFAASIYDDMVSTGVSLSIQTYSTMISVYGRQRKLDKAVEMFNMAQNLGVPLDEKVYTNIISIYGKSGKAEEASALFAKMQEEGIIPGKISYNVMINVYASVGLYSKAEELLMDMQKDGLLPDSLTYLALIKAYTESLKYREAEQIIISMVKEGIQPTCVHYNVVMSAFAKAGLIEEVERVFNKMVESGIKPDLICCRTILRGYLDYGFVDKGISIFEEIQEYVEPDRFIMSAAVHLYRFRGEDLRGEGVLKTMNNMRIPFLRSLEIGSKMRISEKLPH